VILPAQARTQTVRERAVEAFCGVLLEMGAEFMETPFPDYADDPVGFAREKLGVALLTPEQVDMLESVVHNRETNVAAAVGVGKTFVAALVLLWWVYSRGGRAITTAPVEAQVDLVWNEIRELHGRNRWRLGGGECLLRSLKFGDRVRAYGFVAREYRKESFGGRHDPYLLAIIDEASGVSLMVEEGITANLTYHTNRLLRIGNPLATGCPFHAACETNGMIRVPIWTHPNVSWAYVWETGEMMEEVLPDIWDEEKGRPRPVVEWPEEYRRLGLTVPGGPSVEWIEEKRRDRRWGPGTPYWASRLDAEFPEDVERALVPRSWFRAARARYDEQPGWWDSRAAKHLWTIGVDVGDGGDPHAVVARQGPVIYRVRAIPTLGDRKDLVRLEAEIKRELRQAGGGATAYVDRIGIGSGPQQHLAKEGQRVFGVNFGGKSSGAEAGGASSDGDLFLNARAEYFWTLRTDFRDETIAIAPLPADIEEMLAQELEAIRWDETPRGQIRIEPKDRIKKRLGGRSTNLADALALTATPPRPEEQPGYYHEEVIEGGFYE